MEQRDNHCILHPHRYVLNGHLALKLTQFLGMVMAEQLSLFFSFTRPTERSIELTCTVMED